MPTPHVFILGAIALGGIAAMGYIIYKEIQEQQYEEFYQQQRQRKQDDDADDEKRNNNSQLRNRKPHLNKYEQTRESLEQDQYELFELEKSISERKRRLMAEQAFLDREEELLRNRQNDLMKSEQVLNELANTSDSITTNPFSDCYGQDVSSFFENSEHSDSTAIFADITVPESRDRMSSSDLQLPNVSHVEPLSQTTTDTEDQVVSVATSDSEDQVVSLATSDSDEGWDAVSDNDWNQSIDSITDDE